MNTEQVRNVIAAAALALLLGGCQSPGADDAAADAAAANSATATTSQPAEPTSAPLVTGLPDFTRLVVAATPSVVNISSTHDVDSQDAGPDRIPDSIQDWMRRFFEGAPNQPPQQQPPRHFTEESLGSGFIISADGDILTNNHVVAGADEIIVKLSDRRQFVAKVIGTDKLADIALLHIDAKNLPAVKIGDVSKLKAGAWVIAIGSPFGFEHSVTAGIVSAKGRSLATDQYVPFIQTDAAINPGNSGGPLFNLQGEVVGINSQIFSRSGGYMGLSFAIPIDTAMQTVEQLRKHGHVARGWLGVVVQKVDRGLAESFGLAKPEGALVTRVMPDSPAAKGGLKTGDVIVSFDGKAVPDWNTLPALVGRAAPGKAIEVEVVRNGDRVTLEVTPGELDEDKLTAAKNGTDGKGDTAGSQGLGLGFRDLSAQERTHLDIDKGGVMVVSVDAGPAADAGIRVGDVLLRLNHQQINTAEQLVKVIKALPKGKAAAVLVLRNNAPRFLAIQVPN